MDKEYLLERLLTRLRELGLLRSDADGDGDLDGAADEESVAPAEVDEIVDLDSVEVGLLLSLLERALDEVLALIGQTELPEGLLTTVVDMAAGEYLFLRRAMGTLTEFDQENVVRQISQGDTSIAYAVDGGAVSPLEALIEALRTPPSSLIQKWRRVRW